MKHETLENIRQIADVHPDALVGMSRRQRLLRWAKLLDHEPRRRLKTLLGTEHRSGKELDALRDANTPISVAFDDPLLREEGLENDSYGAAKRFFDVSDRELHDILCYCHFGRTMKAATAASRVRQTAGAKKPSGVLTHALRALTG